MLKKGIIKRITISSLALLILLITYFFPTKMEQKIPQTLSYSDIKTSAIYILNNTSYVSRIPMKISANETLDRAKEILTILTIKSKESEYLPTDFYGVIPVGTVIRDISLDNGIIKVDFSKEFLNTTKDLERKVIEAIVFSLTELKEVENVLIFVEGEQLLELPFIK